MPGETLHGGWPTDTRHATDFVTVKRFPGTPRETEVVIPITSNPDDAIPLAPIKPETDLPRAEIVVYAN